MNGTEIPLADLQQKCIQCGYPSDHPIHNPQNFNYHVYTGITVFGIPENPPKKP